jgi:hypothetical protein
MVIVLKRFQIALARGYSCRAKVMLGSKGVFALRAWVDFPLR